VKKYDGRDHNFKDVLLGIAKQNDKQLIPIFGESMSGCVVLNGTVRFRADFSLMREVVCIRSKKYFFLKSRTVPLTDRHTFYIF